MYAEQQRPQYRYPAASGLHVAARHNPAGHARQGRIPARGRHRRPLWRRFTCRRPLRRRTLHAARRRYALRGSSRRGSRHAAERESAPLRPRARNLGRGRREGLLVSPARLDHHNGFAHAHPVAPHLGQMRRRRCRPQVELRQRPARIGHAARDVTSTLPAHPERHRRHATGQILGPRHTLGGIDLHTHLYTVEVGPVAEDAAAGARRHDTLRDGVHRRHVHRIVGMAEYILVAAVVTIGDVAPTHTSEVAHELIGRGVGEVGLHQLVRLLTHESAAVDHGVLYRNQHNESSKKQEECGYVPPELQGHDIAFKTNQIDII